MRPAALTAAPLADPQTVHHLVRTSHRVTINFPSGLATVIYNVATSLLIPVFANLFIASGVISSSLLRGRIIYLHGGDVVAINVALEAHHRRGRPTIYQALV